MPIFEIQMEGGGQVFEVDALDQQTALAVFEAFTSEQQAPQPAPQPQSNLPTAAMYGQSTGHAQTALDRGLKAVGEFGQDVGDFAGHAVSAVPFNDEMTGAIGGAIDYAQGEGNLGELVGKNIDEQRDWLNRSAERSPILSGAGKIAGETAVGTGLALASGGGSIATQPFRQTLRHSAASGGATSALYGASEREGSFSQRLEHVTNDFITGLTVGTIIPSTIKGVQSTLKGASDTVGKVATALKESPKTSAMRKILDAFEADEIPLSEVKKSLEEAFDVGVPTGIVDIGGGTVENLGRAVNTLGGKAANKATVVLTMRNATQPNRVVDTLNKVMGSAEDYVTVANQIDKNLKTMAAPYYKRFYAKKIPITDVLRRLLKTPSMKASIKKAERLAADKGDNIYLKNGKTLTAQGWDYTKRALWDLADHANENMKRTEKGRGIDAIRMEMTDELKRISPDYKKALDTYGGEAALKQALKDGEKIFKGPAREVSAKIAKMSPSEKEVYRIGAMSQIKLKMGETINQNRNFANQLFTDDNFKRLEQAFPNKSSFAKFKVMVRLEADRYMTSSRILGGSQTANKSSEVDNLGNKAISAITGGLKGMAVKSGLNGISKIFGKIDRKTMDEVGDLLFNMDESQVIEILEQLEMLNARNNIPTSGIPDAISRIVTVLSAKQTIEAQQ